MEIRAAECPLERAVSEYIGNMSLWLDVPDPPGATSDRGLIEAGTVALLSNLERPAIDPRPRHGSVATLRASKFDDQVSGT